MAEWSQLDRYAEGYKCRFVDVMVEYPLDVRLWYRHVHHYRLIIGAFG